MIKQNSLILSFLMISIFSFSQIRFGAKAGIQRTNMADVHSPSEGRLSFHVGALAQYNFDSNDQFYIQGELNYLNHGEKNGEYKAYVDYIALPIMLKVYFSEAESEFFGEFGPQFAFEINNNHTNPKQFDGTYGDQITTEKFDISLGFGFGYSYQRKWELGVRYNYGFVDIYQDYESHLKKLNRTSTAAASLSYIFD